MSFQGEIASLPLSDVVQNLVANRKSGTLTIRTRTLECFLQFEGGAIVSYADDRGQEFSSWLVEKGIVSPEGADEANRRQRRSKKLGFGQALSRMGALELEEYCEHLRHWANDLLCEALMIDEGSFEFCEGLLGGALANEEMRALDVRFVAQNVLMEAARRSDDWENIRRHLPSEDEIYFVSQKHRDAFASEVEDEITLEALPLLDGTRTLRQVLSQLPYSRFDGSRCLANLIAEKFARRVDSEQVLEQSGTQLEPKEAITCLEVVLEREPNHRSVLARLASLYEKVGEHDQAAKNLKILATSLAEDGESSEALVHLEKSLELNPRDLPAWQRAWKCHVASGDDGDILTFGRRYLAHFRELGVVELVRERAADLVTRFPTEFDLHTELAEARFALGEQESAIEGLFECADELLCRDRFDEAEAAFVQILKFDHQNEKAQRLCEEIRSGKAAKRKLFFRKLRRDLGVAAALMLCFWVILREVRVQGALLDAAETALLETTPAAREEVAQRTIETIQDKYPLSFTAHFRGDALLQSLTFRESRVEIDLEPTSAEIDEMLLSPPPSLLIEENSGADETGR